MITNINTGCDPSRIQNNEPCFFVNWMDNGQNHYKFFVQRFAAESFKNRLK